MMDVKLPAESTGLQDIRAEIDRIDRQIIILIGERAWYVQAAAKFKTSTADVKATERFEALLRQRRAWAKEEGLEPDMIKKLYRDLVNRFIKREMAHWKQEK
jgi:isochorismate pyruvate lyase